LGQRTLEVLDRTQDQLRAIIRAHNLDPRRQARLNLAQPGFDTLDYPQRVLALPHHHDACYNVALAVPIRDPAAQVRTHHHVAHVLDANRNAAGNRSQYDVANVAGRLRVSAATYHVLGAAELHQAPADVVVTGAHGLGNFHDGNVVCLQPVWIDI